MEFIALLILAGLVGLAIKLHNARARRKFRQAVELYDQARNERIREGESPFAIPTVEMFLAERGELHLLSQIDRSIANYRDEPTPLIHSEIACSEEGLNSNDFDDGYRDFVEEMWGREGVRLEGYDLSRVTEASQVECHLYSLVVGNLGGLYLNLWEGNLQKTYAADGRHKWLRDGHLIDNSAFIGISKGANPEDVLRREPYPTSFEQAISVAYDRFNTSDKKYAIAYLSDNGLSYRVISRVIRQADNFSARCHFRWGERRTFCNSGLLAVLDLQTNKKVSMRSFLLKRNKRET